MGDTVSQLFVDVSTLPDDVGGFVQLLFLGFCYGAVLKWSSDLISDGSELLLLVPSLAGIVGSVVLPILGAVPDGAIVLFSGLCENAQEELDVGVGALAGSTIMLLTIPWSISVYAGRVNLVNGKTNYSGRPRLSPPNNASLSGTGISVKSGILFNAQLMLISCIGYFVIQGPAIAYHCAKNDEDCDNSGARGWALAGMITCICGFLGYLYYQIKTADDESRHDKLEQIIKDGIKTGDINIALAFEKMSEMTEVSLNSDREQALIQSENNELDKRFRNTLKPFFKMYDMDNSGTIDKGELKFLFQDLRQPIDNETLNNIFDEFDADGSGGIDFEEFCQFQIKLLQDTKKQKVVVRTERPVSVEEDPDSEEEEMEIPEDLADLSPEDQKRKIMFRSFRMMALGTVVVLLFSDPMVDVLSEIGKRLDIGAFYVSFVLAPIASNGSELIASYNYAKKKTEASASIAISTLLGAACMNNTFCLAIFLGIIYFKNLSWVFCAETIAILFAQIVMYFFASQRVQPLRNAVFILMVYPASIMLVWGLEKAGLD